MATSPSRVDGTRTPQLTDLPYRLAPILPSSVAAAIGSTGFRLLSELRHTEGQERTDQELGESIGRGERTVQRLLLTFEAEGLIERRRRYGHRTIRLLFSLRGRTGKPTHALATQGQTSEPSEDPQTTHALAISDDSTRQDLRMHSPFLAGSPDPSIRKENKEEQQQEEGVVVASRDDDLRKALLDHGVTSSTAEELVATYPAATIRRQLDHLDHLAATNDPAVRHPAGYLVCSIRSDYAQPPGFGSQATAAAQAEANTVATRRAQEEATAALLEDARWTQRWDQLDAQARERIHHQVVTANPTLRRFPPVILALCIETLRQSAQENPDSGTSAKIPPSPEVRDTVPDKVDSTGSSTSRSRRVDEMNHNVH